MFERALKGLDIATGKTEVAAGYLTVGTEKSTYREGNSTIQTTLVPASATYNTTTNMPNPFNATEAASSKKTKRSVSRRRERVKKMRGRF
jgi:hypothetical protein